MFELLGPLQVRDELDQEIAVPARKQRGVLAVLLVSAGTVVSADRLADLLWDGQPPPSARKTVENYVARLRRALGPVLGGRILTQSPGYVIKIRERRELDLLTLANLDRQARDAVARADWAGARQLVSDALALWRGEPFCDVPVEQLSREELPRLAETRSQLRELALRAEVMLGNHDAALPGLRNLINEVPVRERPWELLMLALYRSDRKAQALQAYQNARCVLREQLGMEPGRELQRIHRLILNDDPEASGAQRSTVRLVMPVTPKQLPANLPDFTGRDAQVAQLEALLAVREGHGAEGAAVVPVISGAAGTGKTALAVHVAHRLRPRFPAGQIYAQLTDEYGDRVPPGQVLQRFLRDLGLPPAAIPLQEAERANLYRSMLADRQLLVVLDDAWDAVQVRPLVPAAGCRLLVTSRLRLPDLDGARELNLGVMSTPEARALLVRLIGENRAAAEADAVADLLDNCSGLPLAIRIAAVRLTGRPKWSIRTLADRIAGARRLDELAVNDLDIRRSLSISYRRLPTARATGDRDPARALRLLGRWHGTDFSLAHATAVLGRPTAVAEQELEILVDAHLLESPAPGHYRFHKLVHMYAAELANRAPLFLVPAPRQRIRRTIRSE